MNTLINTALFCFVVGVTAYVGPAIDEVADAKLAAEKQIAEQQRTERRDRAAREICGLNAGFRFEESVLTCLTKKGRITKKVTL